MTILTKTSFTAGEIGDDLLGRGDLRAYENGARMLRNVLIHPTGGLRRRPGLAFIDQARGAGRLVAFEFNTEQTYLLVLTAYKMDVYRNGVWQAVIETPWSAAHLTQINWTQSADTLLIVHPDVPPRKITRTSHTAWTIAPWSFYEQGGVIQQPYHKFADSEVTLTPSAVSGSIILTASAALFAASHVGTRFRIGGKEVEITAFTSATQATALVKQSLAAITATKDWEEQAFSALRGWPVAVCFHQDRLVIGGSRALPNRLWLSKSSDLFNFDLGEGLDDEAIEFALLSDQVNAIRAVFSGRHLQVFTSGAEWMVTGDPLTPANIQLIRQTRIGSPVNRTIPPRNVDGATLFISRNGKSVREFLFADVEQAYQAGDLSILSAHLIDGPIDQDYDPDDRLLYVVMSNGTLGTLTNYRSEAVSAWTLQESDGAFLSVAVVSDSVYVLIQRTSGVFIERFDADLALDAALTGTSETAKSQWSGLDHLNGRDVVILADNADVSEHTVSNGAVVLDQAANNVQIGLPFTHRIEPLPPFTGGQGKRVRLIRATFRLKQTAALTVDIGLGAKAVPFRRFGEQGVLDAPPPAFTGDVTVRSIGWSRDLTSPLWRITGDAPLPCAILSITTEIKVSE